MADLFPKFKSGKTVMPKKPHVRTLMNSQHVKGSEKLLKFHGSKFVKFFCQSGGTLVRKIVYL